MNRAQLFDDFVRQNGTLAEAAFAAMHPYPFLLGEGIESGHPVLEPSEPNPGMDQPTIKLSRALLSKPSSLEAMAVEPGFVLPVAPRRGSPLEIVTVGRAEDCDLRLVHAHVSHKHAYLQRQGTSWFLTDVGSSNGTFVGGHRLEAKKPHLLKDSEAIRFGPAIRYRFFLAPTFRSYVAMHARIKGANLKGRAAEANPLSRGIEKGGETPSDVFDQALDAFDR